MKYIVKVGINYLVAPIEIREKLTFYDDDVEQAMKKLQKSEHIVENIIFSTCNRTEVFAVTTDVDQGIADITEFLVEWFQVKRATLEKYVQVSQEEETVKFAYRLAVGLDSMILGETQILGQVRKAFLRAQAIKVTGKVFNELFKRVVTFAKSAHSNTAIGEQAISISYVAVELAKEILGDIKQKRVAVLGAGEMAELALKNLHASGVSDITVINRSLENAVRIADKINANAISINGLFDAMQQTDILITSTGSGEIILTKEQVSQIQKLRVGKALCIIDIAVPRDVSADVAELDNVFLYDLDDLRDVIDENMESRKEAAKYIEAQLHYELTSFNNWLNMLDIVPIIKVLRERAIGIQEEIVESIFRKIPDLDEREQKILRKHTRSIVNQLLEQPIHYAKDLGNMDEDTVEQFITIFDLKELRQINRLY